MQTSFILPANGQATPESIARKRKMASAMMQTGMDISPIASPWQGLARVANALGGGYGEYKANQQELAGRQSANDAMIKALQGGTSADQIDAMSNPFMSSAGMGMIGNQWQRQQELQDPAYQLKMKTDQLQYNQMADPSSVPMTELQKAQLRQLNLPPDSKILQDPNTGDAYAYDPRDPKGTMQLVQKAGVPPAKAPEPYTLGEGQLRFGGDNTQVAQGPPKQDNNGITITNPDGTTTQIGGSGKSATQSQSQSESLYLRGNPSLGILDQPEMANALTSADQNVKAGVPMVGNALVSDQYQKARQASNNFLTAILRRESGANINAGEYQMYGDVFLPKFGDGPDVLAAKSQARANAMEGLRQGMSPDAILRDAQKNLSSPVTGVKKPPVTIDGYTIRRVQ